MSQAQKMKSALNKLVIPKLLEQGLEGKYPHYKKIYDDRIELLSFQTNKWGNSFTVEVSTVFLPSSNRDSNVIGSEIPPIEELNVWNTNNRYRLDGTFDGWFYYTDVYQSTINPEFYNAVSETKAKTYVPQRYEKLVQKADDELYAKICAEVNKQMQDAYKWWDEFNKNPKRIVRRERLKERGLRIKRFIRGAR